MFTKNIENNMKYYKDSEDNLLAFLLADKSLEVFTEDGYKFISPKWYTDELFPLLEEISREEFEIEYNRIVEEELVNLNIDDFVEIDIDGFQIPTLYHGTDAKMVRMSDAERKSHKSLCLQVIDYLFPIFKKHFSFQRYAWDCSKLPIEIGLKNAIEVALNTVELYKSGNKLFQYPKAIIYLSSSYTKAKDYAISSFAGGEIGNIAYYLSKVALQTKIPECNPNGITESAMKSILIFGEQKREPIIFHLNNLEFKYLRDERGRLLTNFNSSASFRYLKAIPLDLEKAEFI